MNPRASLRVALCTLTLALAACATLMQPQQQARPQPIAPEPWVPPQDLPEPGDGPVYPQN
jgi:hypothetical protein